MWVWLTHRRVLHRHTTSGSPLADMLGIGTQEEITGYVDGPALLNVESGVMAYERESDDQLPMKVLVVHLDNDNAYAFANTLEEFAERVSAPPRPTVDVPDVFKNC